MKFLTFKILRFTFILLAALNLHTEVSAQMTGKLRGFITDSENGEALAFGNVYIKELNTGASTDENGYFFISSIPGGSNYTVNVSYVGYETKEMTVFISAGKITELNIQLKPAGVKLQEIKKIGKKVIEKNSTDIGLHRIKIKDLEALPKGVETDIFRSLQYLPGVRTTGDVSARYFVRGGASNQNLVKLNGITVYNPFHAFGFFSVIDPEIINNIEFYKGGFSAEYGERLSSVLKVVSKDGNKKRLGAKLSLSYLTGKALLEGPIPHGSFIISGRKSYNNQILKKFLNNQTAPFDFYDIFFKLNYSDPGFIKNAKFEINGFFSEDNLKDEDPLNEDFKWSNNIFGFKWFQIYDSPFLSELVISLSQFSGEVIPKLSNSKPKKNDVKDVSMDFDFTYIFNSKDELGVGLSIKTINTKLFFENQNGAQADINNFGGNISLYTKYKFLRFGNFGADAGVRFNLVGLSKNGGFFFEPRLNLTYRLMPRLALKAAWGIYQQELTTLTDENEVISLFEPWVITPDYLVPARAIHYTAGVSTEVTNYLSIDIEGYYKTIRNLTALNDNKKFPDDPDLSAGTGESYGLEFMSRLNWNPLRLIASYTLSYAYKEIEGWTYYPRYDSRHAVNLALEYNIGSGWQASAVWTFNTGLPFTQLVGFYDRQNIGDLHINPNPISDVNPFTILGDRNIGRLPDYHRLDLNLSKKFVLSFMKLELNFSIINVYDRANIFYFKRDTAERVNMLPFLPTATVKVAI